MKTTKKLISILLIALSLLSIFQNYANAVQIDSAYIQNGQDCRASSSVLA